MPEERALWLAVINITIEDAIHGPSLEFGIARKRKRQEARDWLTRDSRDFHLVCQMAGVEPPAVRRAFFEREAG